MIDLDAMIGAYIECALWSSIDWPEDGEPTENLDANYSMDDLSTDLLSTVHDDCAAFAQENAEDLDGMDPEQAGHDFWLTRNGHGTGFWDRGLGERGDKLSNAAHVYGEEDWFAGSDGMIYS